MSLIFNCNWNNLDQIVLYYIWHCSKSKGKCFFLPHTLSNVANSFEFIIRISSMTNRHSSYSGESCWQHFYVLIIRLNSGLLNIERSSNDALSPSPLTLGSHLSWMCYTNTWSLQGFFLQGFWNTCQVPWWIRLRRQAGQESTSFPWDMQSHLRQFPVHTLRLPSGREFTVDTVYYRNSK